MLLDADFVRLPLRFDADRLADEIRSFTEKEWRKHPQGHVGNSALPLVASGGDPANDDVRGRMLPTPYLDRCPYLQQVLASLQTVIGRTRLMRIEGNGEATMHTDTNYYWMHRARVHVPIVTFPEVDFLCGQSVVNMPAGECWIFDTWKLHNVLNRRAEQRIHLVCDTVGTVEFWDLVQRGDRPGEPAFSRPSLAKLLEFEPLCPATLTFEAVNFPIVMSPGEQQSLSDWLLEQIASGNSATAVEEVRMAITLFQRRWRSLWAVHGTSPTGFADYRASLQQIDTALKPFENRLTLRNTSDFVECLRQAIVRPALNPDLASLPTSAGNAKPIESPPVAVSAAPLPVEKPVAPSIRRPDPVTLFDRPIFIVSAPRSGSSLLFETLAKSPTVLTIGGESHEVIEGMTALSPAEHNWQSNRLTTDDADPATVAELKSRFFAGLRDHLNAPCQPVGSFRFLEKTPKNALRIPFLRAAFPDARFIYLVREPHEAISSIIEAWRSGRFVTYPELDGWKGPWSLLLIPGWQQLVGRPLNEIAAAQWDVTNRMLLDDLSQVPRDQWCTVSYTDLLADPQQTVERLCQFADLQWVQDLRNTALPFARHTLTPPAPQKWRRNASELEPVLPQVRATVQRLQELMSGEQKTTSWETAASTPRSQLKGTDSPGPNAALSDRNSPPADMSTPLKSQHTTSFPDLLNKLGASLLITTYQAGQLVVARVDDQGRLNTHFRSYPAPMGLAADRHRLAIGTKQQVWVLRNQPELGKSLDSRLDACYAPRSMHVTGDIRIHEIGWGNTSGGNGHDDLWIVNTRFSCLCTLDPQYSFVPRWRPPFITAFTPDDRCHLNGMAIVDGRPKYCTALGETDSAAGWRVNKPSGGILLDVASGEIVARGLSMPHSPRIYRDRLWILNSGHGGLDTVDLKTGKTETVARLPGFTRGLDFCGDFAFIGLSQVRETAVFSGIPITEQKIERQSGVWIVDLRTGRTVGFLRFSDQVQEIFAVQVLQGIRFPEIVADEDRLAGAFVLPDEALREVPQNLKAS
jgi:uncharacterized protein (TIGR03032 family)